MLSKSSSIALSHLKNVWLTTKIIAIAANNADWH